MRVMKVGLLMILQHAAAVTAAAAEYADANYDCLIYFCRLVRSTDVHAEERNVEMIFVALRKKYLLK